MPGASISPYGSCTLSLSLMLMEKRRLSRLFYLARGAAMHKKPGARETRSVLPVHLLRVLASQQSPSEK